MLEKKYFQDGLGTDILYLSITDLKQFKWLKQPKMTFPCLRGHLLSLFYGCVGCFLRFLSKNKKDKDNIG